MQLSFVFVSFLIVICAQGAPTARRTTKFLQRGPFSKEDNIVLDSNSIPPDTRQHFNNYFSQLTVPELEAILTSGQWAKEIPFEFRDELDTETPPRSYQELYEDFINANNPRV